MKILLIGPLPPPIHGMSLANKMVKDGLEKDFRWEVDVVNTNTERKLGNQKSQGKFLISKVLLSIAQLFKGVFKILKNKYDVVYITPSQNFWGFMKYYPYFLFSKLKGFPVVIHIHGGYFGSMYKNLPERRKRLIKKALNYVDGIIVLSESLKSMFQGIVPENKLYVCENGVEEEIIATEKEIKEKIERFKQDDTIRIVYLSNLMKEKGILELLKAVEILKKEGRKVHLDVAGAIEPEIEEEIKRYFEALGDTVTYYGVVTGKKKKELLLKNYIFCLPTKNMEGQPISILEAMANGCVIVTTKQGGIPDVVEDGENGKVLDGVLPLEIAEFLKEALRYVDMPLRNWRKVNSTYSKRHFIERLVGIFNRLMKDEGD